MPFAKAFLLFLGIGASIAGFSQKPVTGYVSSGDTDLSGVTVSVRGTALAVQTDQAGNFSIPASAGQALVFSSVGFTSQEIQVRNAKMLSVILVSEAGALNQVIVVGYGTSKKATLTGSVVSVKGTDLVKSPAMNLSNSLAARLPAVSAVTRSGEPGNDGSTLRIRGSNTLNDNTPLVVVDGVPGRQLDRIDPSDIESVTILKDASAAILWRKGSKWSDHGHHQKGCFR